MTNINRHLEEKIRDFLTFFPAVAILGPRQCGKTTLAQQISSRWHTPTTYLDLEKRADLAKLDDCVAYLQPLEQQLVVIDEVQNRMGLFPEIRGLIDIGRSKGISSGRFLFLGSASHELLQQSGESLAGRIAYLELTPFRFNEISSQDADILWLRGGFPDSFLAAKDNFSIEWRRNFIDTYLTKDMGAYKKVSTLPAMRNLITMVAHLHGQSLNLSQLSQSHEFSRKEISSTLDLFEQTFTIRRLQPYHINIGKRLTKSPKIYIRDSGLLHQLLLINNHDILLGHPMRGNSWEGFVIEQIIALLPNWTPYFYRTAQGAEIDLIMTNGNQILAFEIKASTSPKLTKGFHIALKDIKADHAFVVSRVDDSWMTVDHVQHTGLAQLPKLLSTYESD